MTSLHERYPDVLDSISDPGMERVVADLDRMGRIATAVTVLPRHDAAIRQAIYAHALEIGQRDRARRQNWTRTGHGLSLRQPVVRPSYLLTRGRFLPTRQRLVSLAAALALAASGGILYLLRLGNPTPVSAQAVLHRAAAVHLAPYQVAHLVYSIAMTDQSIAARATGTADVWLQADARGMPMIFAQTLTISRSGEGATAPVHIRYIEIGRQVYVYDVGQGTILVDPDTFMLLVTHTGRGWVVPNALLDGVRVARFLSAHTTGIPPNIRLQLRRPLDGHPVNAIAVEGWPVQRGLRTTFYFDAHSSILRGFDAASVSRSYLLPSWQVRLRSTATPPLALSATFRLNAPATARVVLPPGDGLIPTRVRADTAALHAAVASGQITAAQEAAALAGLRAQQSSRHFPRLRVGGSCGGIRPPARPCMQERDHDASLSVAQRRRTPRTVI